MNFVIGLPGNVKSVRVASSDSKNAKVGECIKKEIGKITFKAPDGGECVPSGRSSSRPSDETTAVQAPSRARRCGFERAQRLAAVRDRVLGVGAELGERHARGWIQHVGIVAEPAAARG